MNSIHIRSNCYKMTPQSQHNFVRNQPSHMFMGPRKVSLAREHTTNAPNKLIRSIRVPIRLRGSIQIHIFEYALNTCIWPSCKYQDTQYVANTRRIRGYMTDTLIHEYADTRYFTYTRYACSEHVYSRIRVSQQLRSSKTSI